MSEDEQRIDDESLEDESDEERLERELDVWGFFGGRTPDGVASTLDTLRGVLPPASTRDRERASQRFFDGLEERLSRRGPTADEILNLADLGIDDIDDEEDDEHENDHEAIASSAPAVSTSAPTVPWPHAEDPRQAPIAPDAAATPPADAPNAAWPQVRKAPPALVATTPSMDLAPEARALFTARQADASRPAPIAVVSAPKGFGHTLPLDNQVAQIVASVQASAASASASMKKEEQSPRAEEGIAAEKNAAGAGASAGAVAGPAAVVAQESKEWTVERYASLSVELSLEPDRAAVLERYHVRDEAALAALVGHWKDRIAREPGLKAAVDAAKIQYTVWWSANRMGKGQGR